MLHHIEAHVACHLSTKRAHAIWILNSKKMIFLWSSKQNYTMLVLRRLQVARTNVLVADITFLVMNLFSLFLFLSYKNVRKYFQRLFGTTRRDDDKVLYVKMTPLFVLKWRKASCGDTQNWNPAKIFFPLSIINISH